MIFTDAIFIRVLSYNLTSRETYYNAFDPAKVVHKDTKLTCIYAVENVVLFAVLDDIAKSPRFISFRANRHRPIVMPNRVLHPEAMC